MPKITIIDGNSLLFRSYYATAYPGVEIMRNQEGTPTNAVFAFSNMINKILTSIKEGESLMVAFDAGKHNFRHDALETYKANRKPAPEDLVVQFPIAREFLRSLGVFQFEEVGFEGDDIAGTVAKLAEEKGYEVTLYTSDRDFLQLVSDNITVNIIRKGLSDVVSMTPALVEETYGFKPLQIIDYKGLRGDDSDNLPGIPGVGEKTAVKLIQDYGSFDEIIAHADDIKGKLGEKIKANQELGRISRDLAIIKTDVEIPFTLQDTIYQGYSFQEIAEFCKKYGLKQFMSKIQARWKKPESNEFNKSINKVKKIPCPIKEEMGIAIDLADDNYTDSEVFGMAIYANNEVYYLDIEDVKLDKELLASLKDGNIKKYCYDFKALKVALSKIGIEINGAYFDLLLASYLLDSSIKNNAEVTMNMYGVDLSSNADEMSLFFSQNPDKTAKIAYFSKELSKKVLNELEKHDALNVFETLEMPLADTLADMEIEGFPLNRDILDSYGDEFKAKLNELSKEIWDLAGEKFNIASPKQLGDILFNKLGLPSNKKGSTAVDELTYIKDKHPIVPKILEYRKYFKLVSTYIDGLKVHIHKDGKIYAKFNQALTTTGRLSSSEPNLQNISVRDEESKCIRKAFKYDDENVSILSLDYSQIELRVLAHLSNCEELRNIFLSGEDIHSATAKKIFKLQGEPTSAQRRKAKTVNFGVVYGISDFGLSNELGISIKEAKDIIDSFYNSFPEVATFFEKIISDASKDGYVSTLSGRRRYLVELHDSNYQVREFAKRAAMNAPIQGSAADLIKIAMIKVDKALKEGGFKTKMALQIHDELIFKVPNEEKEKVYDVIESTMEHALDLSVPLRVDGGFGKDWYDAK